MSLWDRAEMYKWKLASSPSLISGWAPVIIALLWIVYTVGVAVRPTLPVNHHQPAQTLTFPAVESTERFGKSVSRGDFRVEGKACSGVFGKEVVWESRKIIDSRTLRPLPLKHGEESHEIEQIGFDPCDYRRSCVISVL
jgi:hypothetical protein